MFRVSNLIFCGVAPVCVFRLCVDSSWTSGRQIMGMADQGPASNNGESVFAVFTTLFLSLSSDLGSVPTCIYCRKYLKLC